ncbi:MAG: hypothetical protein ACM3ML_30500, partial [Micromonosporaceae bacterium]
RSLPSVSVLACAHLAQAPADSVLSVAAQMALPAERILPVSVSGHAGAQAWTGFSHRDVCGRWPAAVIAFAWPPAAGS